MLPATDLLTKLWEYASSRDCALRTIFGKSVLKGDSAAELAVDFKKLEFLQLRHNISTSRTRLYYTICDTDEERCALVKG
jgi:hypothetical protein